MRIGLGAIAISEEYAKRMLEISGNPNHSKIAHTMVWEYPSHDFCIDFDEASAIGLPVERLPEQQDLAICEALFKLERNEYHGFISPAHQSQHAQTSKAKKSLRKHRPAIGGSARGVNGRGGESAKERITPQRDFL